MRTIPRRARTWHAAPLAALSILLVVSAGVVLAQQGPGPQPVDPVSGSPDACPYQPMALVGEVRTILGPRLFTITVPGIDSDRLVFVRGPLVAAVATGFPVCVAGAIVPTRELNLVHEWGTFDDRQVIALAYPTATVTNQATSGGTELVISAAAHATFPDASAAAERTLTDLEMLTESVDSQLVGRFVNLRNVRISVVVKRGFWIASDHEEVFVLPADETHPQPGQHVNIKGIVLRLPDGMTNRLGDYGAATNEIIYIYASQFRTL
jgi:hypothetical protein